MRVIPIDAGGHRERFLARRDELVREHIELARQIAIRVSRSLPPSFDLEDLIATGNMALVHAANRYRPAEHGCAPFSAFARPLIRGAILDSIRRRHYEQSTRPALDEAPEPAVEASVEVAIDQGRMRQVLAQATAYLSPREQTVLALYYSGEGARFEDIGRAMGVSRTTAQNLHASAIAALRRRGDQLRNLA